MSIKDLVWFDGWYAIAGVPVRWQVHLGLALVVLGILPTFLLHRPGVVQLLLFLNYHFGPAVAVAIPTGYREGRRHILHGKAR